MSNEIGDCWDWLMSLEGSRISLRIFNERGTGKRTINMSIEIPEEDIELETYGINLVNLVGQIKKSLNKGDIDSNPEISYCLKKVYRIYHEN